MKLVLDGLWKDLNHGILVQVSQATVRIRKDQSAGDVLYVVKGKMRIVKSPQYMTLEPRSTLIAVMPKRDVCLMVLDYYEVGEGIDGMIWRFDASVQSVLPHEIIRGSIDEWDAWRGHVDKHALYKRGYLW